MIQYLPPFFRSKITAKYILPATQYFSRQTGAAGFQLLHTSNRDKNNKPGSFPWLADSAYGTAYKSDTPLRGTKPGDALQRFLKYAPVPMHSMPWCHRIQGNKTLSWNAGCRAAVSPVNLFAEIAESKRQPAPESPPTTQYKKSVWTAWQYSVSHIYFLCS